MPTAEAIWYYAQDDREHGPVTAAYIAGMSRSGKLRPDDLVWREGMADWKPAKTIKGLFPSADPPAGSSSDTAVIEAPFDALPPISHLPGTGDSAPNEKRDAARPAPPPPPEQGPTEGKAPSFDATAPSTPVEAIAVAETRVAVGAAVELWRSPEVYRRGGRVLVAVGFLFALFARGCDSLAARSVARAEAQARLAELRIETNWENQRAPLEQQRQPLEAKATRTPDEEKQFQKLLRDLAVLEKKKIEKQTTRAEGAPLELASRARESRFNNLEWALWREVAFLCGAVLLSVGAFALVLMGRGPERWLGLVILGVILLGLFSQLGAAPGGVLSAT